MFGKDITASLALLYHNFNKLKALSLSKGKEHEAHKVTDALQEYSLSVLSVS